MGMFQTTVLLLVPQLLFELLEETEVVLLCRYEETATCEMPLSTPYTGTTQAREIVIIIAME